MQTVVERCLKNGMLAMCFSFKSGTASRDSPDLLFTTIARELGAQDDVVAEAISAAIEKHPLIPSAPLADQFERLVSEPLHLTPLHRPVVILIDALDEGSDSSLLEILIDSCSKLPARCRIIVSSRRVREIDTLFTPLPHITITELSLHSHSNLEDVSVYAHHSLRKIGASRKLGGC